MRALLVADRIRLPFSDIRSSDMVDTCLKRGRLELFPAGSFDRWSTIVSERQEEIDTWARYFAQRMCEAFAVDQAVIEMHEAGHRISWAWDNGSGQFPDTPYPRGMLISNPRYEMRLWDELERDVLRNPRGATTSQANFAVNAAPARATDRLLIDLAMQDLAAEVAPYSRLMLLGSSANHLKWIVGTAQEGIAFEPSSPSATSSVLSAMLGTPTNRLSLSKIPIERFLDLCDELGDARRSFSCQLSKWSEDMAKLPVEDRGPRLAAIARDEIIPAMHEFNSQSHRSIPAIVRAIPGADIARIALGAIALSPILVAGLLTQSTSALAVAAATAAAATLGASSVAAAGDAAKQVLVAEWDRKRSWTAFAAALTNELRD